jgi:phage minor structural protein
MIPILYLPEEVLFDTLGIGVLTDATSCVVTEKLNSSYELVLKYPVNGIYFHDITYRSIIIAKPNAEDRAQPFRVYKISRPMNGTITVNAEHISYDLVGVQVAPFEADNAADALKAIQNGAATNHRFTFHTDNLTAAKMKINTPESARYCLFSEKESVLKVYGGEYRFDRFHVELLHARGADRGFSVRYGVNLTDINQEQNCQDTYTGIYPYYYNEESGVLIELPEKIVNASGDFGYTKIKSVDLTSEFDSYPREEDLRAAAYKYVADNQIGKPKVSITLKFEQLRQYEEYKNMAFFEDVSLGDTVTVIFEKLGVDSNAKCVKTVYDSLLERYDSIELGDLKRTVADTVITLENMASETIQLTRNIAKVTAITTANSAKLELLVETDADGTNSVRGSMLIEAINEESTAKIQADRINLEGVVTVSGLEAGTTTISGSAIKTGVISSDSGTMTINLDEGTIVAANFSINQSGSASLRNAYAESITCVDADVSGTITSSKGWLGNVKITTAGLECGDTYLSDGGLRTVNGNMSTLIASGVIRFGNSVTIYAPTEPVSGGIPFLGVFVNGNWKTLYFDNSSNTVKYV